MLSLDALANWEGAILASISGAGGTLEEQDAQITRSGMYAEYPAVFASYLDLIRLADAPEAQREALKRAVFLAWHSFVALPVDSGISELPESSVRAVMAALETAIASGHADDELRAMLTWYRDTFGAVFELFGPVRSLDPFIRDLTAADARAQLGARAANWTNRGQLGVYWSTILST